MMKRKFLGGVISILIVVSLVFALVSCGQPAAEDNTQKAKQSPVSVNIYEKVPDTGFFIYYDVSKDSVEAMEELQKKLLDAGVVPGYSEEDTSELADVIKQVSEKYKDITKRQYGVVAIDWEKLDDIEDKEGSIELGPSYGLYFVGAVEFSKEVTVKEFLTDVKGIIDEINKMEQREMEKDIDMDLRVNVDEGKICITAKGEDSEESIDIEMYFEQHGKTIVVAFGKPFSQMETVDNNVTKSEFWNEATKYNFALYFDVDRVPDEEFRNDMAESGWDVPIKIVGGFNSSEKNGVYSASFSVKFYVPDKFGLEDVGIDKPIGIIKDANLILAVDIDALLQLAEKSDTEFDENMVAPFRGGVVTISGIASSAEHFAASLIVQYVNNPDMLWNMYGAMLQQYVQQFEFMVPNPYTLAQKTDDGFKVAIGTFEPEFDTQAVDGNPILYVKMVIEPDELYAISNQYDPELSDIFAKYDKVIKKSTAVMTLSYDSNDKAYVLKVSSEVETK